MTTEPTPILDPSDREIASKAFASWAETEGILARITEGQCADLARAFMQGFAVGAGNMAGKARVAEIKRAMSGGPAADAERAIRAEVAADLRRAAAGRREYARTASKDADERDRVELAADAYESAAGIAEDPMRLLGLIPSWRWTAEETASVVPGTSGG